jgi:hypothetical protein
MNSPARLKVALVFGVAVAAALLAISFVGHSTRTAATHHPTPSGSPPCPDANAPGTTFGWSTTHNTNETFVTAPSVTVETYATRITGSHNGTTVYDETIPADPASQAVLDAQQAARDAIVAAGGELPSTTGPTLVESDRTLDDSSVEQTTESHEEITETVSSSIGPATIQVGENQSLTCEIRAGTEHFNFNTHYEIFDEITSTTTETYLNFAHYELTDSGASQPNLWQDVDCSGAISVRDNQALLRFILEQPPLSQTQPCPAVNAVVSVASFAAHAWGNGDCNSALGIRDNQATLRFILEQPPLSQTQPCPEVGQGVTIITPG